MLIMSSAKGSMQAKVPACVNYRIGAWIACVLRQWVSLSSYVSKSCVYVL